MSEEIDNVVLERILRRQEKANERILKELGKILGEIGNLTPSEAYTIGQQLKYGESLNKIIKIISETSKINEVEIYRMLELEARKNLELKRIYFKAKKKDFIPYEKNIALQNKVREIGIATLETYRNIARSTGITFLDINGNKITRGIREAYYEIVDDAITNVSTGKETFYEALKNQLKTIGQSGVQSIDYESGYHRRIDSAMRMNLSDGLNQLAIAQEEIVGEQFGFDGWRITVHENPAPDHQFVQGQTFTKEEYEKLQEDGIAHDINGKEYDLHMELKNGENAEGFRPIGQMNCYHYAWAIVIGVDTPRYSDKELKKIIQDNNKGFEYEGKHFSLYEGTQLQRRVELELRKTRETKLMAQDNDQELFNEMKIRERQLLSKYRDIRKASGLKGRLERARLLTK
jgi:hypothetical protein